jgi:hypothetical protein
MKTAKILLVIFLLFPCIQLHSESFRAIVQGSVEVTPERPAETPISISNEGAVIINLGAEARFLRGVELEITAPQAWLSYRGALAVMIYSDLSYETAPRIGGIADMRGNRIAHEPLPSRLRTIYHIPVRQQHGLRTTASVTVPTAIVQPISFPILFKLLPADKGMGAEFDRMRFSVTARPILSNEGAVRIETRFPPQLRNRPFTVLINDNVISNLSEQIILREGEHHLVILSDDYRNESRRFVVERARVLDLIIDLQDPTPIILFEGPQNAEIFLNNNLVPGNREPIMIEPGSHEVRFKIGDYTVIRTLNIQRGKTYRVALEVDLTIHEED